MLALKPVIKKSGQMGCWPDLTFTPTNLPPLLCSYMPSTAAEAAEVIWRLRALLHHWTGWENNDHGAAWLVHVQPRVALAEQHCWFPSPGVQGGQWLQSIPEVNAPLPPTLVLQGAALSSEVNRTQEVKLPRLTATRRPPLVSLWLHVTVLECAG